MRVGTFTMYQDFTKNQERSIKYLNDVNRQIYSGTKIEYGYQDTNVFVNTLRLDQEEYTLSQNALGADMARQFALNSDNTMNQMVTALTDFKTKLIKATSESNSATDRGAIAQELIGLRQHLINLANTSINGQYLFSGSAFSQKPIDANGNYQGNSDKVKSLINSGVQLPFNIDGTTLFLGSDNDYGRTISTNVPKKNITLLYNKPPTDRYITLDDKIQDMTGNNGDGEKSYFYVTGTQSDGTSFKQRIDVSIDSKISDLLDKIKDAYKGNVDVTLNNYGQIEVKDLQKGSSKLQFHIVGSDNSVALTKATAGFSAGSTVLTLKDVTGIDIGDKLNVEGIGKITVTAINAVTKEITFTPPLPSSAKPEVTELNIKKVLSTNVSAPSPIGVGSNTISLDNLHISGAKYLSVGDKVSIGNLGVFTITATGANTITFNSTVTGAVAVGDKVDFITNISDLPESGVAVTEFIKSGMAPLTMTDATAWNDRWDHSVFNFNVEYRNRESGAFAEPQELLSKVLGNYPTSITLNGNTHAFALGVGSTMRDLVDAIQSALDAEFGLNQFSTTLVNGKIVVKDKNIDPNNSDTDSSKLITMTLNGGAPNTFASINGIESDKVYFKKEGAILSSNVSQVVNATNKYAKPSDTLLSTSGVTTMVGKQLTMQVTTISGNNQNVTINFGATTSTFTVAGNTYNILNAASPQTGTPGDQVTYRQLMDVMSMVISDTLPASITPATPTLAEATDYNNAVIAASKRANVYINDTGKITIEDKTSSATKANLSMYDSNTNTDFANVAQINTNSLTLNSNNALTIDDPYISFFDQLQMAIEAVQSGKTRATDNGNDPRNIGMQNAILAIDHVFDHVVRKHTEIGAVGNSFQLSVDRSTTLKINVKTVRSQILDTDIGSAYLELNQRSINYQALLATVKKIQGLSLVNYM